MSGDELPATERALVGLCHGLNDQLAALNAYVFLLERRGILDEEDAPLREHLHNLAQQVRLIRSLARDPEPEVSPVSVSLLAESATAIMDGYPGGSVVFEATGSDESSVVRVDWNRAVRALLVAGEWVSRGGGEGRRVSVAADGKKALLVSSEPRDSEANTSEDSPGMPPVESDGPPAGYTARLADAGFDIEVTGLRSVRVVLP